MWSMAGPSASFSPTFRDQQILKDLWLYRYLQTPQIARLHFDSLKVAQRRMRRLHEAKLVERFRADMALRAGFRTWVYRLARPGAQLLSREIREPVKSLLPPIRSPASLRYLEHHRELTDFRIWLREGCRFSEGEFGYRFIPDYEEIRHMGRRRRRVALDFPETQTQLIPDGVFTLDRQGGRSVLFTLEIDRGTEPLRGRHPSSIKRKFLLYEHAFNNCAEKQYSKLFETEFRGFRILCIVGSIGLSW